MTTLPAGGGSDSGQPDVIVVGAGHNGLTAGCYLAKAGKKVLVLEASPTVGGMTSTNATLPGAPNHRFNEGAIQLTGIFRLSGIAEELELAKYGLRQIEVDPAHIQLAPDGSSLADWVTRRSRLLNLGLPAEMGLSPSNSMLSASNAKLGSR